MLEMFVGDNKALTPEWTLKDLNGCLSIYASRCPPRAYRYTKQIQGLHNTKKDVDHIPI